MNTFLFTLTGKNGEKEIAFYKITLMMRFLRWNIWCAFVKAHPKFNNAHPLFVTKMKLNLSILVYFFLLSMVSSKGSDEAFTTPCHSQKVSHFDSEIVKISLPNTHANTVSKFEIKIALLYIIQPSNTCVLL